jgi:uncharacterized membrane protein YphA (DoxX/SURF4 family)
MLTPFLPHIFTFSRIGVGLIFFASSLGKLRNIQVAEQTIIRFDIIPRRFIKIFNYLVLICEISIVLFLLVGGKLLAIGFLLAIFLLLAFSISLASVLARGIRTPCNCFGSSHRLVSACDVWRNIGFIVITLAGLVSLSVNGRAQENLNAFELGLLALMAIVFMVLWAHIGEFVELFSST